MASDIHCSCTGWPGSSRLRSPGISHHSCVCPGTPGCIRRGWASWCMCESARAVPSIPGNADRPNSIAARQQTSPSRATGAASERTGTASPAPVAVPLHGITASGRTHSAGLSEEVSGVCQGADATMPRLARNSLCSRASPNSSPPFQAAVPMSCLVRSVHPFPPVRNAAPGSLPRGHWESSSFRALGGVTARELAKRRLPFSPVVRRLPDGCFSGPRHN